MRFTKWQGCGNDFALFDFCEQPLLTDENFAEVAVKICDRHFGIGADGVLVLTRSERQRDGVSMRIFNADGTEPQMCGNGIRCLARYAFDNGVVKKREFAVETKAGVMYPKIAENGEVEVDMGEPTLTGDKIPVAGFVGERVINAPLNVNGQDFYVTCVSMGNPHCVVFSDKNRFDIADAPEKIGAMFEHHEFFPERVNVEFAEATSATHIRMRVWERGSGVTMACGTGACATLVAAVLTGRTERKAHIDLDGGTLAIEWRESDNRVYMTGAAEQVFAGDFLL